MRSRRLAFLLAVLSAIFFSTGARAEEAASRRWEEWRASGNGVAAIETTWSAPDAAGKRKATVSLRRLDSALAPAGDAIAVHSGPVVMTALAARADSAAVVLFNGGPQPFVKVALVDLGTRSMHIVDLARTAGADYAPTAAVACAEADGFTVLWQEEKRGDPSAEAKSTLARVKTDGTFLQTPKAVPIPWSLGAIVDDGRGYTLAVNFDGSAPDQTRICFVTLTREGQPEQHPWWGSRPGSVADVALVSIDGNVKAVWRGSADGQSILTSNADKQNGQWGKDPPASQVLARGVAMDVPFAARAKGNAVEIVKR